MCDIYYVRRQFLYSNLCLNLVQDKSSLPYMYIHCRRGKEGPQISSVSFCPSTLYIRQLKSGHSYYWCPFYFRWCVLSCFLEFFRFRYSKRLFNKSSFDLPLGLVVSLLGEPVGDGEEWLLSSIDLSLLDFERGRWFSVGMESISMVSLVRDEDKQLNDVVSGAE